MKLLILTGGSKGLGKEKFEKNPFNVINFDPYIRDTSMQKNIRNSKKVDFPTID